MKRLILLLLSLCLTKVVVQADMRTEKEKENEIIDDMWRNHFNQEELQLQMDRERALEGEFSAPSHEHADLVHQIDSIRQNYWEAYKKGGADFEAAKVQFSSALFYRDVFLMLADSKSRMPDIFRSPEERAANVWWDLLGTMTKATQPGNYSLAIQPSALTYFHDWSNFFHAELTATSSKAIPGIPNPEAVPGIWQRALPLYETYQVARDWTEEAAAPFPLPIDTYVFDLVRRWPVPATEEQAIEDYRVLLDTFGKDRVFSVAQKVQAASNKEGEVADPDALGISQPETESKDVEAYRESLAKAPTTPDFDAQRKIWQEELDLCLRMEKGETYFYAHNPYWALWYLLTKEDPNLTRLYELYRDRGEQSGPGAAPSYLRKSIYALKSIVDKWNGVAPTPTPTPVSTPPDPKLVDLEQTLRRRYAKLWASLPEERRSELHDEDAKFIDGLKNEDEVKVRVWTLERRVAYLKTLGAYELHDTSSATARPTSIGAPTPAPTPLATPISTPIPAPTITPYPEAAELWKEREHLVRQEYDEVWTALPEATRLQLHDDELSFQDTINAFDPPTRIRTLRQRIEHFKTLYPKSALASRPSSASSIDSGVTMQEQLRLVGEQYDKIWAALPEKSRSALREQELLFRESLKGLDGPTALKQLQHRVLYLKRMTPIERKRGR